MFLIRILQVLLLKCLDIRREDEIFQLRSRKNTNYLIMYISFITVSPKYT
jgi:hypothetical protein